MSNSCSLCSTLGGELIWENKVLRVIQILDENYPGYCRVVWKAHITEMTDLSDAEQTQLMAVVFSVERGIRYIMQPDKINLASLGNQVPHIHWHIIPRFCDDLHFPSPIWSEATPPAKITRIEQPGWQIRHAKRRERSLPLKGHLRALLEMGK